MECLKEQEKQQEKQEKEEIKNKFIVSYRRFDNLGNTCYMGSILHILQQCPILADYFYIAPFSKNIIKNNKSNNIEDNILNYISYNLYRLFTFSISEDDRLGDEDTKIKAETFRECIGRKDDIWLENNHQDSQEFLNFLIYKMEEEIGIKMNLLPGRITLEDVKKDILEDVKKDILEDVKEKNISFNKEYLSLLAGIIFKRYVVNEYSPLKEMFGGLLLTKTKCEYCSNVKNIFDPINMLQLSIPDNNLKEYTLDDCLEFFLKQEQLDKCSAINCEFCSFKSRAYKNYLIWKTPKILIIHFKRFEKTRKIKLTNKISYPVYDLDLSKYMDDNSPYKSTCKYNLIGINLHDDFRMGRIDFGHYTSMVKNRLDNKWLFFNDGKKPQVINNEESLQQKDAYMLFYYRDS